LVVEELAGLRLNSKITLERTVEAKLIKITSPMKAARSVIRIECWRASSTLKKAGDQTDGRAHQDLDPHPDRQTRARRTQA